MLIVGIYAHQQILQKDKNEHCWQAKFTAMAPQSSADVAWGDSFLGNQDQFCICTEAAVENGSRKLEHRKRIF